MSRKRRMEKLLLAWRRVEPGWYQVNRDLDGLWVSVIRWGEEWAVVALEDKWEITFGCMKQGYFDYKRDAQEYVQKRFGHLRSYIRPTVDGCMGCFSDE